MNSFKDSENYRKSIFIRHFSGLVKCTIFRCLVHPFLLTQNRHKRLLDIIGEFGDLFFCIVIEVLFNILSPDNKRQIITSIVCTSSPSLIAANVNPLYFEQQIESESLEFIRQCVNKLLCAERDQFLICVSVNFKISAIQLII